MPKIRLERCSRLLTGLGIFSVVALLSATFFSATGLFMSFRSSADAADLDLNVSIAPNLAFSVVDNNGVENLVSLNITPNANGVFATSSTNLVVSTTNETGYTITMSNADESTSLAHTDATITSTIPTLTAASTESNFPVNYYGYNFNGATSGTDLLYSAIPPLSTPTTLIATDAHGSATYPFTVAAKANTSLHSGTYEDTIVFTATANYVPTSPLSQISNMQEMTPAICEASSVGDEAILTDTRDNKTYVVRKLADNRCWMVQNLRLGGSSAITLTPADSNVTANFTLSASSNSFGADDDATGIDINRMYDNGNNWVTPTVQGSRSTVNTSGTPASQTQYQGNYYNWYTATAGSGTYSTSTDGAIVTQSICPKGWRLPNGGAINATTGNGEFQQLYDAYGNYNDFIAATSAVLSGVRYGSSSNYQGSTGSWWSRTAFGESYGYALAFSTSNVSPQLGGSKRYGYSVRCIADNSFEGVSTMQDMTTAACTKATIGAEKILRDTRDNNTYTIRKMEDNNCWMTQNLRLGTNPDGTSITSDLTLTSADSDVSNNFTIPTSAVQTSGNTDWGPYNDATAVNTTHIYNNGNSWIQPTSSGGNAVVNTAGSPSSQSQYIGNYYNYYAATAGSGTYNLSYNNATSSICPKGWKLPTSSSSSDFTGLTSALVNISQNTNSVPDASFVMQSIPNYFILSGLYYGGMSHQGMAGRWWGATSGSASIAYPLRLSTSDVEPQGNNYKVNGFSVRCIAQ